MSVAYEVVDGCIELPQRTLLSGLELELHDCAVTALVGPGGVGKSSLLRVLAGKAPVELNVQGQFRLHGADPAAYPSAELALFGQTRGGQEQQRLEALRACTARVILLDEPAGQSSESRALVEPFSEAIRKQGERACVVLVTHNLNLVRAVADWVALLCAGRLDCYCSAEAFFDAPPTPLARQFARQGNCWPRAALPKHFHWVTDQLAGMGRPGLLGEAGHDLATIAAEGVDVLVSLTTQRVPQELLSSFGITGRHLPIRDMGVPAVNAAASLCRDLQRATEAGSKVAFHCEAGLGRTGTMLATFLVWNGHTAEHAISRVREHIRGAIQNRAQEAFVERFAQSYGP